MRQLVVRVALEEDRVALFDEYDHRRRHLRVGAQAALRAAHRAFGGVGMARERRATASAEPVRLGPVVQFPLARGGQPVAEGHLIEKFTKVHVGCVAPAWGIDCRSHSIRPDAAGRQLWDAEFDRFLVKLNATSVVASTRSQAGGCDRWH